MPIRALIVAIERYPSATSLPTGSLAGTTAGALAFHKWLIEEKKVAPQNIVFCGESDLPERTTGTSRSEVAMAIRDLARMGRDDTDELYAFLSGHGFSYLDERDRPPLDVLICSDFQDPAFSGGACLQLREMQHKLLDALGPGQHFYFVDACRNRIKPTEIDVPTLGLTLGKSELGEPTVFTLFSTALGFTASVGSGFSIALVDGLRGRGRAKAWIGTELCVTFEHLCNYVKTRLRDAQQIPKADRIGDSEAGTILTLPRTTESDCTVEVDGAKGDDAFTLLLQKPSDDDWEVMDFSGPSFRFTKKPHDYYFQLTHLGIGALRQIEPPADETPSVIDLYDPCHVRFTKAAAGPRQAAAAGDPRAPKPANPRIVVDVPESATVLLRHMESNEVVELPHHSARAVPPGHYELKVRELGVTIDKRELVLPPDARESMIQPKPSLRPAQRSILAATTGDPDSPVARFSEALGEMMNQDLALWLAILGASRIVGVPGMFSKLKDIRLATFDQISPDRAPLYVLIGTERADEPPLVAVSEGPQVHWKSAQAVVGLEDVYETLIDLPPGPRLLSLRMDTRSPITVATVGLPNRATFFTIADDDTGRLSIHQFLLPIHHLRDRLDANVRRRIDDEPLKVVRMMALAQRQFAKRKSIEPEGDARREWDALSYAKWFDPVMSLVAAFQMLRQDLDQHRDALETMLRNLRRFFPGLSDTEAIARRLGVPERTVDHPPLLLDALRVLLPDVPLPLPEHRLDYDSPWVTWRAAVPGP